MLIDLAHKLLSKPSVTPNDEGCQILLAEHLDMLGFKIRHMNCSEVSNLWASRIQRPGAPTLVFAGHTDVVPPGPQESWLSDPFLPTVRDNKLYARGAADMKVALACMISAYKKFIQHHPNSPANMGFVVTSSEEKTSEHGMPYIMRELHKNNTLDIRWCLIGEASSKARLADQIKIGRRGSLSGELTIHGKQGHIAYPHLANNPIHSAAEVLAALVKIQWDCGNKHFEPTSLQFSSVHSGVGADNVIPNALSARFNLRYSPEISAEQIEKKMRSLLDQYRVEYSIKFRHSGPPFYSKPGELLKAIQLAIRERCREMPNLSTGGGTSDGRFIAPYGVEVVELGFCGQTIHQPNECVDMDDIVALRDIYYGIIKELFAVK